MSAYDDFRNDPLFYELEHIGRHLRTLGLGALAFVAADAFSYPYTAQKTAAEAARVAAAKIDIRSGCDIEKLNGQAVNYTSSGLFNSFPYHGTAKMDVGAAHPIVDVPSGTITKMTYALGITDARPPTTSFLGISNPVFGLFNPAGKPLKDTSYTLRSECNGRFENIRFKRQYTVSTGPGS